MSTPRELDPEAQRAYFLSSALRPAGGGVHLVSTGLAEQRALQRKIYQLEADEKDEQIEEAWLEAISKTYSGEASGFILGVPSDTGAGFRRGANLAPAALRERRLEAWPRHSLSAPCFVDVGDVRVIPHLLSEEMISSEQRRRAREALYEDPAAPFPVTPLGICQSALRHLIGPESGAIPIVLGGDHSVSWPAFLAAFQRWERSAGERVGILHFDAHTDLLPDRLGVKYCFATWAYHANELLGRDGRLVQLGIRASGRDQAHWESTLGVHQLWADALRSHEDSGIEEIADQLIDHFQARGVKRLYISVDIDGTDEQYAAATGTPESGGLPPWQVRSFIRHLGAAFPLAGADLVEVAPSLGGDRPGEPAQTLDTGLAYLEEIGRLLHVEGPASEPEEG